MSAISFASPSAQMHRQALHDEDDDPRPSSTSVVATLRHSPRLLLRKKASALKEPAQSPDIFARGPGPALRASTRMQTRNASARMHNARSKKSSRQQQQQPDPDQAGSQLSQYTISTNSNHKAAGSTTTSTTTTTMTTTMTTTTTTTTTTSTATSTDSSPRLDATDMMLGGPVQTRASRASSSTISSTASNSSSTGSNCSATITAKDPSVGSLSPMSPAPSSRILAASSHSPTSIATEDSCGLPTAMGERRSRIATRSTSQTRDPTRPRTGRTRARARAIPAKTLQVPGVDAEKSDEDDDEEEDEVRIRYHLRSPAHRRRHRSLAKTAACEIPSASPAVDTASALPHPMTPRLTRLGARHESGHDIGDEPDQEHGHHGAQHLKKADDHRRHQRQQPREDQQQGRRSPSATSSSSHDGPAVKSKNLAAAAATHSSPEHDGTPTKIKKKSLDNHVVPSLPTSRRRLRARTTKVAKMGIDGEGGLGEEEDEEEEEEEEEEEDDDAEYDIYPRSDPDEEMLEAGEPTSTGLEARQQVMEDVSALASTLDGFIASKPEASLTSFTVGLTSTVSALTSMQGSTHHAKRKVEDEDMEDAPSVSMDEGQVVSTKLARIDEASDGDRTAYLKTFYSILKNPRGDDDDGILSSESEDADLESEDDEDDFEEIDIWEFIATLPPLGPLPSNYLFTMPERTTATPPITLVLDIDETLVHCATRPLDSPDIVFPVEYNQETWEVYGRIRPGMLEFLEKMSTKFEVITFTAIFGNYVKDLRILNRDLSKVVIIDNSPQAFGYQISNGIPIESWYDDKSDRELSKVMSFLETLEGVDDVRPKIDEQYKLQERIQKALAAASHQQISSMSGLGALGTTLTSPSASGSNSPATSQAGSSASSISGGGVPSVTTGFYAPTEESQLEGVLQGVVPDDVDIDDTTMMFYEVVEKPPSPSDEDDEREEDEEKALRGRRGKVNSKVTPAGTAASTHVMTMKTRSNSLDAASNLAKISL
ncbi:hypothetical protein BGZ70_003689 [Mortierella alpina]|uniref:FCP1 homology domain-containing protein n=1 Tax=Mortierella alpina TaxID=64518 RepID=A0A9P6JA78_MORAP|nr:hypothetical protein BGZ70_003689 [Mortierella alpina]